MEDIEIKIKHSFDEAGYLMTYSDGHCPSCSGRVWTPYIYVLNINEPIPFEKWMLSQPRYDKNEGFGKTFMPLVDKIANGFCTGREVELCRHCGNLWVYNSEENNLVLFDDFEVDMGPLYRKKKIIVEDRTKEASPGLLVIRL